MTTSAYPLQWPEGWERTAPHRRSDRSQFKTTFDKARRDLTRELELMGARNLVISTNIPLRLDGQPRADMGRRRMDDPGVAVYFTLKGRQMVMARDAYSNVHDNLRSIGLAIVGLRSMERHGGGAMLERAFEGFSAIAAPGAQKGWREILGFVPDAKPTLEQIRENYRHKMKTAHPDVGGSDEAVVVLNGAMGDARREMGV